MRDCLVELQARENYQQGMCVYKLLAMKRLEYQPTPASERERERERERVLDLRTN
jgi:hypothetical protein